MMGTLILSVNDSAQIDAEGNAVVIRKPRPTNLEELFDNYDEDYKPKEWDTGPSVGREI